MSLLTLSHIAKLLLRCVHSHMWLPCSHELSQEMDFWWFQYFGCSIIISITFLSPLPSFFLFYEPQYIVYTP